MKVLLIHPPAVIFKNEAKSCHLPLGLAYLASVLRMGHSVSVLDCVAEGFENENIFGPYMRYGLSLQDIRNRIIKSRPEIIGISCLFSSVIGEAKNICRIAKEINPGIVTILGGTHPTAMPEETLKDRDIDFVIAGEGEYALKELVDTIENGGDPYSVNGVFSRHNLGLESKIRDKIENLDSIPFPAWEIFPLERYFKIRRPHGGIPQRIPFFPMVTSRGCPNECIFCSIHALWGKKFRARSPSNVLSEMSYLKDKFNCKEIFFEDDNLTWDRQRARLIFEGMIEKKFGLIWSSPNGIAVNTIDDNLLEKIKKSGCRALSFGIESGDSRILNTVIKKSIDLEHAERIVKKAGQWGIETAVFFVVGFPEETKKELGHTFTLARRLEADNVNFFFATPLPGSVLFKNCRQKGLIPDDFDYHSLRSGKPHFDMTDLSKEELELRVKQERSAFNKRLLVRKPGVFLKKIRKKLLNEPSYFIKKIITL